MFGANWSSHVWNFPFEAKIGAIKMFNAMNVLLIQDEQLISHFFHEENFTIALQLIQDLYSSL